MLLLRTLERIVPNIRTGSGPRCIEIATYRFCGHVGPGEDEAMAYRSTEEVMMWKQRDPVAAMRRELVAEVARDSLERLESEINGQIHAAIVAAKRAEWANFEDIMAMNWSGQYSSIVEFQKTESPTFKGSQSEALPGPF
jgi:pyruvate dehydrogenase E1 component alpha subunit